MLNENIKALRKARGLSQEELAIKLNVVRQTVSKWEKGLSVPDAGMLVSIAEALDTSVTALLDAQAPKEDDAETLTALAAKLELLNEQFAKRSEQTRRLWRCVFIAVAIVAVYTAAQCIISAVRLMNINAIIGGADGPTSILVASAVGKLMPIGFTVVCAAIAAVGLYKTRRK